MTKHEDFRDATVEAIKSMLDRMPPERVKRLMADIRLSAFSDAPGLE